jgi:2-oxoglutarate dehydrogenase E2 component (dihydrolipoamide succinyltransferase)
MPVDITVPSPGESITEVTLGPWHKASGQWVQRDETLVEIESDKVTLELPAPESGVLTVSQEEGAELNVGDVIGSIDPEAPKPNGQAGGEAAPASAPAAKPAEQSTSPATEVTASSTPDDVRITPVAKKIAQEKGIDLSRVTGSGAGGKITKEDVLGVASSSAPSASPAPPAPPAAAPAAPAAPKPQPGSRSVRREKMTKLRQRIAERLVHAQHTAAMLTTFNEVDMSAVMNLRNKHKDEFEKQHDVRLGFMSFFTKACCAALQAFPRVNAYIDGPEIEYHEYVDISIAVGTPKGLIVPVLRNVEAMSFADVELAIKDLAIRGRDGKLSIEEMTGGNYTISNGGVYGSLNSTPILNPPQSGILGLHKIQNRPVEDPANPGQIVLRPMMYLAMSYDHRIIDGEQAVSFLVHVKNCIEQPERMLIGL